MASSGASALVVINSGEDAEDLFRVAATLGGRSGGEVEPKGPENMATVRRRDETGRRHSGRGHSERGTSPSARD